jgi:hypothetical protein
VRKVPPGSFGDEQPAETVTATAMAAPASQRNPDRVNMTKRTLTQAGPSILPRWRAGARRFDARAGRQGAAIAGVTRSRTMYPDSAGVA